MSLFLAMMAMVAEPSGEALRLGREVAERGMLMSILPTMQAKETEDLVAEHPDWSDADKAALRATAATVYAETREKLIAADARAYAEHLSIEDLREIAAFARTGASQRMRAAMPKIIISTMAGAGAVDYKGDVRKRLCKERPALCPK
ncbi:DUF2059 domain-containing protein [Sphingomonas sp. LY29]|uniref:DUF2059 domain-containing protein n=1 Tax=Sphingomonas sp. LY29 TaxID=3095341 RepID=UPI002D7879B5|nr:DUF2059 domain-containing protein [Sphingomonas sp. LY29]WRP25162.1 DUF2059 domain-containing protein [Sphingomonas sp. LY29]